MLPPCSPEVMVEMAWPSGGATPKHPSIGASGSLRRPGHGPGGEQVFKAHSQGVAGLGALDRERTRLRVGAGRDALSCCIIAQRVHSRRDDRIAVGDAEHGLVPADGVV